MESSVEQITLEEEARRAERINLFLKFLDAAAGERTMIELLTCMQAAYKALLPESCFCLWLLDAEKEKICRLLYEPHASCPVTMLKVQPATKEFSGAFQTRSNTPLGEESRHGDFPGTCTEPRYHHSISLNSLDGHPMLLTICSPRHPQTGDLQFLEVLTKTAFQCLERVRVFAERQILAEIAQLASTATSLSEFLMAVVKALKVVFSAGACSIFLFDKRRNKLALRASTGIQDPAGNPISEVEYDIGEGLTGYIGEALKTVRLYDVRNSKELTAIDPKRRIKSGTKSVEADLFSVTQGPRQFLGVPICLREAIKMDTPASLIGVLRLHKKQYGVAFFPHDEKLAFTICEALAPAINRWSITAELEKAMSVQSEVFEVVGAVHSNSEIDLNATLQMIVTSAQKLFDAYGCSFLLADPDNRSLTVVADVGPHPFSAKILSFDMKEGLCGAAATSGQVVKVPNVRSDSRYICVHDDVRSEICLPAIFQGECLGVLNLDGSDQHTLDPTNPHTIKVLEILAKQAAVAIHRCRLSRDSQRLQEQLFRTMQKSAISCVADELAHQLKNRLSCITGLLTTILQNEPELAVRKRQELAELSRAQEGLFQIAGQLMNTRLLSPLHKQRIDLNDVVKDASVLLGALARSHGLTFQMSLDPLLSGKKKSSPAIIADPQDILQVLINLVLNAVDACKPGDSIKVMTKLSAGEFASFAVSDSGSGIRREDRKNLFTKYFTTKGARGHGLGLTVCKRIVKQHSGGIKVASKLGAGTKITINLPITKRSRHAKKNV
jgi:signal transduction histidine kinase